MGAACGGGGKITKIRRNERDKQSWEHYDRTEKRKGCWGMEAAKIVWAEKGKAFKGYQGQGRQAGSRGHQIGKNNKPQTVFKAKEGNTIAGDGGRTTRGVGGGVRRFRNYMLGEGLGL